MEFPPEIAMMPIAVETMTRRLHPNRSPAFKAKAALDAVRGKKTLSDIAEPFDDYALGPVQTI